MTNLRIFISNLNQYLIVFENAGKGLCHFIYEIVKEKGKKVLKPVSVSGMNVVTDIIPVLTTVYKDSKKVDKFPTEQEFMATLSFTKTPFLIKEDLTQGFKKDNPSISAIPTEDIKLYLSADSNNNFVIMDPQGNPVLPITIEDIKEGKTTESLVDTNDLVSHQPVNTLSAEEKLRHLSHHDADLSASIESNKSWLSIIKYLEVKSETNHNQKLLMLLGPKGVGKTTAAEHVSQYYNMPFVTITADPSVTIEDLFCTITPNMDIKNEFEIRKYLSDTYTKMLSNGGLSEDDIQQEFDKIIKSLGENNSQWKRQMSMLFRAYTEGWIIIINEINNFSPAVLIALNDAFYGSSRSITIQGQTYFCHEKTIVIGTSNYGYQGNNPMNEAFIDRFYRILMTDLIDETYGNYLSKKYSKADAKGILAYTKFGFKLMQYMEETFENQDRFSPATPAISIRGLTELLPVVLHTKNLKQNLGNTLYAILHGVEDPKTTTQAILTNFEKEISTIETLLFIDKKSIQESDKAYNKLFEISMSQQSQQATSNNLDSLYAAAANAKVDNADAAIATLTGLGI